MDGIENDLQEPPDGIILAIDLSFEGGENVAPLGWIHEAADLIRFLLETLEDIFKACLVDDLVCSICQHFVDEHFHLWGCILVLLLYLVLRCRQHSSTFDNVLKVELNATEMADVEQERLWWFVYIQISFTGDESEHRR